MEVVYGLLPAMLIVGLIIVAVLFWAARSGQYRDLEGPAHRILMDDDDPLLPQQQADATGSQTGTDLRKGTNQTSHHRADQSSE